ncbi:CCAAT/enhancer-binding protein-like [Teleopsis dalmanni]|uniref:CCAAT/enhancer-binding protein-like n=1 Tax=Teleopsis dalmanni TaxID=139649 RepID=UPI0018CCA060|nr:CCAAT/enhancer-binding protein-like [Teleopsis dalmanni]XP_037955521.1 CCAAT/enhancer-binding protein-like [Teleopsis dalmanni]
MLNMESPQMYDTVQSLSHLDLKKQPQQAIIGQITLTAMSSAQNNNNNANGTQNNNTDANNNNTGVTGQQQQQNSGLVVKQHAVHQLQHAAAALNNNNNTSTLNANMNNVNNLLQKQMLQQYSHSDIDELTAQEITLDLQHLIDDQFREQEALGIFSDMVASPGGLTATLPPNGMVSAAAKVLQHHQLQQQSLRTQQHNYGRSPLAYMPQAVHSGAAYNNHSSDENSSIGSDSSTIKEEPIDPDYRRHLQEANVNNAAAAFITNGGSNGLYNPYQSTNGNGNNTGNGNNNNNNNNNFTTLTSANVLAHHSVNLPHLAAGAHLLKHHNKQLQNQRKSSLKHVDKGTEEYRRRRERNNIAVRKSREKAKVRSREVEERVKSLLKEKEALLRQLQEMTNELQLHKQIYMQLMNHTNPEVSRVCRSFLNTGDHGL